MAIIIDGKQIARELLATIRREVDERNLKLRLGIVITAEDPATNSFVRSKVRAGEAAGIEVRIYKEFTYKNSANKLRARVGELLKGNDAMIIQLTGRNGVENIQRALDAVPLGMDVDVLSSDANGDFLTGKGKWLPPLVSAVRKILSYGNPPVVDVKGKEVVVVGTGPVAGRPVSIWFIREGATVTPVNKYTRDVSFYTRHADIIVSCVGKQGIITGDMVKDGVIAIDVGMSTGEDGKLHGDFDFNSVAQKAAIITPVPGGVGPIAVAMLMENTLRTRLTENAAAAEENQF